MRVVMPRDAPLPLWKLPPCPGCRVILGGDEDEMAMMSRLGTATEEMLPDLVKAFARCLHLEPHSLGCR